MFLFSDIEGSTSRWESNRDGMERALQKHDALLHAAIVDHGGCVFKTIGDAFCAVFDRALDATAAAVAIQRRLALEDFSDVNGIRVRIAIHEGITNERDGDYFGPPVNRVARLLAVAHGGQTLVSGPVASRLAEELPEDVRLRDLGWHRLKDLEAPELVFQLDIDGLPAEFEAIKSLNAGNNLPRQTTSFVGREEDVEEIETLLQTGSLVSIVGVGGVGKTRVALQVAADALHQHRDGAWFVNFAPISDPALVASAILTSMNAAQGGETAMDALVRYLRDRELLLVLDNCEHLLHEVATIISKILESSPGLRILATTRQPLGIPQETVYRLNTLPIDQTMQLFMERAVAAKHGFAVSPEKEPVLKGICERLDGIPLALELAAPRLRVISLDELNAHLNERFRVLTSGNPAALPRQQTMHALIDWSYDLLIDVEKVLFRRLSVFAGSFSLQAVSEVCANDDLDEYDALDVLSALVEKSLVVAETSGDTTRYHLLQTLRDYARRKLFQTGENERISECHASFFATVAEQAYDEWDRRPSGQWLPKYSIDLDNFRVALHWAIAEHHAPLTGARIIAGSFPVFLRSSLLSEAIELCERVLATNAEIPADVAGRIEFGLSTLYNNYLDQSRGLASAERAAILYQGSDDVRGMANAYAHLAQQYARHSRYTEARPYAREALDRAREINDTRLLALTLQRCAVTFPADDIAQAREHYDECVSLFESLGRDEDTGRALVWWAASEADAAGFARATELLSRALPLVGEDTKLFVLLNIAEYAILENDLAKGFEAARSALEIAKARSHPNAFSIAVAFVAMGSATKDPGMAAKLFGYARSHFNGQAWPPPQYGPEAFQQTDERLRASLSSEEIADLSRAGERWDSDEAYTCAMSL